MAISHRGSNVGVRDIAEAVGVRGASLYHHFASREEILFEICLAVTREPVEQNLPSLDAAGTPSDRLANLVAAHIRHLRRRRVEHLVGLHDRACLTEGHYAEIDRYRQYCSHRVRDVLTAGMRSGEFREMNPKLVVLGMLDMLNGVSGCVRGEPDEDVEDVVETYLHTASSAAALVSSATSRENPPPSLLSMPRLREGRYGARSHVRSSVSCRRTGTSAGRPACSNAVASSAALAVVVVSDARVPAFAAANSS